MKIIKSDGINVLINIGNANTNTLNRLVFENSYRPRSENDRNQINVWKEQNSQRIIFCSNGRIISKPNAESYNIDGWKLSANGNYCLSRRSAEKLERDLKKMTSTEIFQLALGLRALSDGMIGIGVNPIGESLRDDFNLKALINDVVLSQEKHHHFELDRWIKKWCSNMEWNSRNVSSFSRIYTNTFDSDVESGIRVPFGSTLHTCSQSDKKFLFWSFKQRELWTESKIKFVNSNLKFVSVELLDSDFIECKQCGNHRIDFEEIKVDNHFHNSVVCKNGFTKICSTCYEKNMNRLVRYSIDGYNHKPTPIFHSFSKGKIRKSTTESKQIYYGWELEMESRTSDLNLDKIAYQIKNDSDNYLYCKRDGSIGGNGGFEVVSHPSTFNAIKNMDLNKMVLRHKDTMKGFHTRNCGMHIHINRNSFTDLQLYKFILFLNEYEDFTKAISQRRRNSEFDWCQIDRNQKTFVKSHSAKKIREMKEGTSRRTSSKKYIPCHNRNGGNGRYSAVNMINEHTIEVRIFKSNMDESAFRKNIEFVDCMFYFCKDTSPRELTIEKFSQFADVNKKDYPNLNTFLSRVGYGI